MYFHRKYWSVQYFNVIEIEMDIFEHLKNVLKRAWNDQYFKKYSAFYSQKNAPKEGYNNISKIATFRSELGAAGLRSQARDTRARQKGILYFFERFLGLINPYPVIRAEILITSGDNTIFPPQNLPYPKMLIS